jgi:hypothetical protein
LFLLSVKPTTIKYAITNNFQTILQGKNNVFLKKLLEMSLRQKQFQNLDVPNVNINVLVQKCVCFSDTEIIIAGGYNGDDLDLVEKYNIQTGN